jgi:hypothetical protein
LLEWRRPTGPDLTGPEGAGTRERSSREQTRKVAR